MNAPTWSTLQAQLPEFNRRIAAALDTLAISESAHKLAIDHACVRFNTQQAVDGLLAELAPLGQVISSEVISGRLIHVVELNTPLLILNHPVYGLEIPYPKADQSYSEGWEHVEFVLPQVKENTATGVTNAFFERFPTLEQDMLCEKYEYKVSEPGADTDQLPNPTVGLKVNGVGLKFHALPIQKVVGYT